MSLKECEERIKKLEDAVEILAKSSLSNIDFERSNAALISKILKLLKDWQEKLND